MKRLRHQAFAAVLIFAVAAAVRLVHVAQIRHAPFFTTLMGDARGYDAWAMRVANGDWFGGEVFYQAPLYPYFLGVIYATFGRDLLLVRIIQALVGAASCALLGLAAARLFSPRAGLVAGLALGLYAPAIFFDGLMQKSVLDVFFVCLSLWLMSRIIPARDGDSARSTASANSVGSGFPPPLAETHGGRRRGAPKRQRREGGSWTWDWLLLGLAMGALALTRENAMVFIAVIIVWALVGAERVRVKANGLRAAAAFVLGLALVLVPVAFRNYAVGGGFYVTTSQMGPNFFIGNNPRSDGTYMSLRFGRGAPEYERQDATELAEHALGRSLMPSEVSSYWTNRALGFITSQPGAWLRLMGRKFLLLWNADEMLDTESQETYAEWSWPLKYGAWIGHFGVLVPLAVLGMWAAWPERRRFWVFYAMTFAYALSVMAFYVFARYRFPLVPLLILFAATGVMSLPGIATSLRVARSRQLSPDLSSLRPVWLPAALVIGVAVGTNWPVLSKPLMQAITENNLAVAFQEDGRLDDALTHYRRALDFKPDYAPAHNNMGAALRAKGELDEAVASYQRALNVQPDYADAHYNLANALLDGNRPQDAAAHFRLALAAIPGSAAARNNLGIALANEGRYDQAIDEFRAALAVEPDSAKTNRNLGKALSELGRKKEALGYLRQAAQLDPKDKDARYDLGIELLDISQFAEAASEFQAAVALDPGWPAAYNNLGIALASLDRLDEAIEHFRRALEIQPDFPDAKRNLAIALAQRQGAGR
jgi:tetratricopeptide (TPR) repeat protein